MTKRSTTPPEEAIELTTFKLRGSLAAFIAANAEVDVWLAKQPGFRSRRITQRDDGRVVDLLSWDTVACGERAAERLLVELRDSPVHGMIDRRTVRWSVLPVHHAYEARTGRR